MKDAAALREKVEALGRDAFAAEVQQSPAEADVLVDRRAAVGVELDAQVDLQASGHRQHGELQFLSEEP